MQYSPKLKKAAAEIRAILEKHDIAGIVVLHNAESYADGHTQGFGEYLYHISPSYSIAKIENGGVRLKTNPLDTKENKLKMTSQTYNMVSTLADVGGPIFLNIVNLVKLLETQIEVLKSDKGDHTSHNQQNN